MQSLGILAASPALVFGVCWAGAMLSALPWGRGGRVLPPGLPDPARWVGVGSGVQAAGNTASAPEGAGVETPVTPALCSPGAGLSLPGLELAQPPSLEPPPAAPRARGSRRESLNR